MIDRSARYSTLFCGLILVCALCQAAEPARSAARASVSSEAVASAVATAELTPATIAGEWTMCRDEDGNARDRMEFHADGHGYARGSSGEDHVFVYAIAQTQLTLIVHARNRLLPLSLRVSADGERLIATSPKTGKDSEYVRAERMAAHGCTP